MNHWLLPRGLHADQRRRRQLPIELLSFTGGMHQFPLPAFSRLTIQPGDLLPAGMEITSYNHHANAPSSPGALVLKPRLPGRSSLRSYPINPSRFSERVEFRGPILTGICSFVYVSGCDLESIHADRRSSTDNRGFESGPTPSTALRAGFCQPRAKMGHPKMENVCSSLTITACDYNCLRHRQVRSALRSASRAGRVGASSARPRDSRLLSRIPVRRRRGRIVGIPQRNQSKFRFPVVHSPQHPYAAIAGDGSVVLQAGFLSPTSPP